jgi:hypothetical protein
VAPGVYVSMARKTNLNVNVMKRARIFFTLVTVMLFVASCINCKEEDSDSIVGNWQLTGIQTTGLRPTSDPFLPDYSEYYEFKTDYTFRLVRSNGIEYKGTYTEKRIGEENYIEGTFEDAELLKAETFLTFCTFTPGTVLLQRTQTGTLVSSCAAADGNIFTYSKVGDE